MLYIDANGYIDAIRITKKIFHSLHHGDMGHVNGIVVHQTGRGKNPGPTAFRQTRMQLVLKW